MTIFTVGLLFSCENKEVTYPDFDYTTVYFASQYPLRTLELGEDSEIDNTLDNEHKVRITATMGGVYSNSVDRIINFEIDETLCDGVSFVDAPTDLVPMPANYYNLESGQIIIKSGNILGGVVVELTDAFFEDPLAIDQHYVIPVLMTSVVNADSILSGQASSSVENPNRMVSNDWVIMPKDYVLYAIKYVNPWHAIYLRRGEDVITKDGVTTTSVRHKEYVEYDEVTNLATLSMTETEFFPSGYINYNGTILNVPVKIAINERDECSINIINNSVQVNDSVNVYNITASGIGNYVVKGEKNSLGGVDRNAFYLDYEVGFEVENTFPKSGKPTIYETQHYTTKDTLVCRNRGIVADYYDVNVVE